MSTRPYLLTSGILFGFIAILQAVRLMNQWPAQVGTWIVPLWPSGIAVILATGLCFWAFLLIVKDGKRGAG